MLVKDVYLKCLSGKLTCSDSLQLLMDQPTTPNGRKVESHAHLHVNEGFQVKQAGFGGDATSFAKKQLHWQTPTHLYPAGQATAHGVPDFGRMVQPQGNPYYDGVVQDPNRLPPTREYADRTGLGELPAHLGPESYQVKRNQVGGPPIVETYNSMLQVQALDPAPYRKDRAGAIMVTAVPRAVLIPQVSESPAHSMFPDSESQVMHLTGALLSDAGQVVLRRMTAVAAGAVGTFGIMSKIAVRAVTAVDAGVPNQLVERRLEVDQTAPRNAQTGRYPATGTVLTATLGVDHVVVVMGKGAAGQLNLITYYPNKLTIDASIGVATGPMEDVARLVIGQHTVVKQVRAIPRLRW